MNNSLFFKPLNEDVNVRMYFGIRGRSVQVLSVLYLLFNRTSHVLLLRFHRVFCDAMYKETVFYLEFSRNLANLHKKQKTSVITQNG